MPDALKHCPHPPEHREPVCLEDAYYVLCKLCGRGKHYRESIWRKPTPPKPVPEPGCQHRSAFQVERYDPTDRRTYRTLVVKGRGGRKRTVPVELEIWRLLKCPACKRAGYQIRGEQVFRWEEPIC